MHPWQFHVCTERAAVLSGKRLPIVATCRAQLLDFGSHAVEFSLGGRRVRRLVGAVAAHHAHHPQRAGQKPLDG